MSPEVEQLIAVIREEGRKTREAIGRASEIIAEALNDPRITVADDASETGAPPPVAK